MQNSSIKTFPMRVNTRYVKLYEYLNIHYQVQNLDYLISYNIENFIKEDVVSFFKSIYYLKKGKEVKGVVMTIISNEHFNDFYKKIHYELKYDHSINVFKGDILAYFLYKYSLDYFIDKKKLDTILFE